MAANARRSKYGVLQHTNAGKPRGLPTRAIGFTSGHWHVRVPGGGNMRSTTETGASQASAALT
jgi:hypothetical protein